VEGDYRLRRGERANRIADEDCSLGRRDLIHGEFNQRQISIGSREAGRLSMLSPPPPLPPARIATVVIFSVLSPSRGVAAKFRRGTREILARAGFHPG